MRGAKPSNARTNQKLGQRTACQAWRSKGSQPMFRSSRRAGLISSTAAKGRLRSCSQTTSCSSATSEVGYTQHRTTLLLQLNFDTELRSRTFLDKDKPSLSLVITPSACSLGVKIIQQKQDYLDPSGQLTRKAMHPKP